MTRVRETGNTNETVGDGGVEANDACREKKGDSHTDFL